MPSAEEWLRINASGAVFISVSTIIAAVYLLWSLWRQGRGRLRVRLLLGMVISDLFLGLAVLPSEAAFLAKAPITTGTVACTAQGFIFTTILFTQHLWTLAIAIATFLLLKYPMSRTTTFLDTYSWACTPVIWIIAIVHSGVWWAYVGWASSGTVCYYGSYPIGDNVDARDIIQFVPRAFVFIVIVVLYSMLFKFLRRPDTIQLSSQFVTGDASDHKDSSSGPISTIAQKFGKRPSQTINPEAPWEAMEFVQIGNNHGLGPAKKYHSPTTSRVWSKPSSRKNSSFAPALDVDLEIDPLRVVPELPARPEPSRQTSVPSLMTDDFHQQRPSDTSTLNTPELQMEEERIEHGPDSILHILSPILSDGKGEFEQDISLPKTPIHRQEQTLAEFFQQYQVTTLDDGANLSGQRRSTAPPNQMSAAAYFNRQASLLMLYFPLAYLVVFSISLARLIYNMAVDGPQNPVLNTLSAWMVLSAGFIDGLVYGLAEFVVRYRVRKKMPDHMG